MACEDWFLKYDLPGCGRESSTMTLLAQLVVASVVSQQDNVVVFLDFTRDLVYSLDFLFLFQVDDFIFKLSSPTSPGND